MIKKNLAVFLVFLFLTFGLGLASPVFGTEVYYEGEGYLSPTEFSRMPFDPEKTPINRLLMANTVASTTTSKIVVNALTNNYPDILLYITVTDNSGQIVTGLKSSQIAITEKSSTETSPTVETITRFEETNAANQGISIALVFDVSSSMNGQRLADAKSAAISFINTCSGYDRVALVKFSSCNTEQIVHPSNWVHADNNANSTYDIVEAINSLTVSGFTAVYDGSAKGIEAISQEAQPKAVIVFTDGETNDDCKYNINTVIALAQNNALPLYTIGLGLDPQNLKDMAAATGGQYHYAPNAQDMATIYADIRKGMLGRYVIGYTTHNPLFDGTTRTVTATYQTDSGNAIYTVNSKPVINRSAETVQLSSQSQPVNIPLTISGTVTDLDAQNLGQTLSAKLYYRHIEVSGYTGVVLNLSSTGGGQYAFSATIPGQTVQAPGIEYYIHATDGMHETYSPFNWNILPYAIAVLQNHAPVIVHQPVTNAPASHQCTIRATNIHKRGNIRSRHPGKYQQNQTVLSGS